MGMFAPVLMAYTLNANGWQVFREPKEVGPGPLVSLYIFMFSAFVLLWDIRLYPRSLRKLGKLGQGFIEFLIAEFLMEHLIIDFWFPLELVAITSLPKLADAVEDAMAQGDWSCDVVCDVLRNETVGYAISYMLSTFFFLAVLHATRAIDLRELEYGPGCFFGDITHRLKLFRRRMMRRLGLGPRRKVKISEIKNTSNAGNELENFQDYCGVDGGEHDSLGMDGFCDDFESLDYSSSNQCL